MTKARQRDGEVVLEGEAWCCTAKSATSQLIPADSS
jgi:hypothetical protein